MNSEVAPKAELGTPALEVRNVTKWFGGIHALDNVSLECHRGEILGLVGDNGAGKSTLLKIIAGAETPTSGQILVSGELVHFRSPGDARKHRIETVYQDLALVDAFDVAGNFFLGVEPIVSRWLPIMRLREMQRRAEDSIRELHVKIRDATSPVRQMSGGQRQAVSVARAVFWNATLLMLDEPTAALGAEESSHVMQLLKSLAQQKTAMLIISHNLQHVWELCDRIVVLRQGKLVASLVKRDTTPEEVIAFITGARPAMTGDG